MVCCLPTGLKTKCVEYLIEEYKKHIFPVVLSELLDNYYSVSFVCLLIATRNRMGSNVSILGRRLKQKRRVGLRLPGTYHNCSPRNYSALKQASSLTLLCLFISF